MPPGNLGNLALDFIDFSNDRLANNSGNAHGISNHEAGYSCIGYVKIGLSCHASMRNRRASVISPS